MRRDGFSLIELMIVIAIIAIIAALALPSLVSTQVSANERNASTGLKTVVTSEVDFRANDRENNRIQDFWTGDLSGLYRLSDAAGQPLKLIELPVAQMDGTPMAAGSVNGLMGPLLPPSAAKAGYWVMSLDQDEQVVPPADYRLDTDGTLGAVHNMVRFAFIAYPETYGVAGRKLFLVHESGVIYKRDPGSDVALPATQPVEIQPAWRNYPNNPPGNGWSKLD
jgi:prepilin-type N-terminal cleavage/methylation domain-containing protein